ncbi:hypothetical protein [Roseomonas haemaphysalidis]|uniref:Uncharacterized protein n=1 Tax=Roseomonas haemaphysalidis TaxID=2768162 RepID=A0ABS3KMI9_9PROT|nr:hypothetical protein [Roseomonas haemaphysalidis]MBO1078691.1 hypothetical protein [Roseomonas haemaphysalidis]
MRLIPLALLGLFAVAAAVPSASAASPRDRGAAAKVVKPAARAAAPVVSRGTTARAPAPRLVSRAAAAPALRNGPVVRGRTAVTVSSGSRARQTAKATGRSIQQQPQVARGSIRGGAYEEVAEAPARFTGRGARYTSWQSGLPAASGDQRDCPAGTMSTLARGHADVVRCMPL